MTELTIKAIAPFTGFTGEMRVFNKGDVGALPDVMAREYIEAGLAKAVTGFTGEMRVFNKGDASTSALSAARKRYREVFGKGAGPKWTVDVIEAKIAAKLATEDKAEGANPADAADEAEADNGGETGEEAPPAE